MACEAMGFSGFLMSVGMMIGAGMMGGFVVAFLAFYRPRDEPTGWRNGG